MGPADALAIADASQDVVCCQQCLQFFHDKEVALKEMRRALKPGGHVAISVWAAEHRIGVFESIIRGVEKFIQEPYPRAFDPCSFALTAGELSGALHAAGFSAIHVEQRSVTATWTTMATALAAIQATPYGPLVAQLPLDQQAAVYQAVAAELGSQTSAGGVSCVAFAHLARASA